MCGVLKCNFQCVCCGCVQFYITNGVTLEDSGVTDVYAILRLFFSSALKLYMWSVCICVGHFQYVPLPDPQLRTGRQLLTPTASELAPVNTTIYGYILISSDLCIIHLHHMVHIELTAEALYSEPLLHVTIYSI